MSGKFRKITSSRIMLTVNPTSGFGTRLGSKTCSRFEWRSRAASSVGRSNRAARCSTDRQDLAAQHQALLELGVAQDRIYTDHGLTGTNRARLGLDQALAAVRQGDTLVVPFLDRLARSVPDARAIADQLQERGVKLALGRALYDPDDPMGKMFFNILATFAEFEADLIRMRTREGMAIARAKGKLRAKQPKLMLL